MLEPTRREIALCARILARLKPGFLPEEIFEEVARIGRLPTVDLIPIQQRGKDFSIGLVKREEGARWWPGMWHLPGTFLRSTDTVNTAFKRLLDEELAIEKSSKPTFRGHLVHVSDRGAELVLIYTIENCVLRKASTMQWCPVDKLPKNFIKSERHVVKKLKESLK